MSPLPSATLSTPTPIDMNVVVDLYMCAKRILLNFPEEHINIIEKSLLSAAESDAGIATIKGEYFEKDPMKFALRLLCWGYLCGRASQWRMSDMAVTELLSLCEELYVAEDLDEVMAKVDKIKEVYTFYVSVEGEDKTMTDINKYLDEHYTDTGETIKF